MWLATCRRFSLPSSTSIRWCRWTATARSAPGWRRAGRFRQMACATPSTCAATCNSPTARRSMPKRSRPTSTTWQTPRPNPVPPVATSVSTAAPRCSTPTRPKSLWRRPMRLSSKCWPRAFSASSRPPHCYAAVTRTAKARSAAGRSRWCAGTGRTRWNWCATRPTTGRHLPHGIKARRTWNASSGSSSRSRRCASPRCRPVRSM